MAEILTIAELLKRGKEQAKMPAAPVQAATPPAPQFNLKDLTQAAWWASAGINGFGAKGQRDRVAAQTNYLNALTGAAGAVTNQTGVGAAAALDLTKARLAPGESAAQIALQRAQGSLLGAQASVVVPESQARIAQARSGIAVDRANIGLISENTRGARINNTQFTPDPGLADQYARMRLGGVGGVPMYSLGSIVPGR